MGGAQILHSNPTPGAKPRRRAPVGRVLRGLDRVAALHSIANTILAARTEPSGVTCAPTQAGASTQSQRQSAAPASPAQPEPDAALAAVAAMRAMSLSDLTVVGADRRYDERVRNARRDWHRSHLPPPPPGHRLPPELPHLGRTGLRQVLPHPGDRPRPGRGRPLLRAQPRPPAQERVPPGPRRGTGLCLPRPLHARPDRRRGGGDMALRGGGLLPPGPGPSTGRCSAEADDVVRLFTASGMQAPEVQREVLRVPPAPYALPRPRAMLVAMGSEAAARVQAAVTERLEREAVPKAVCDVVYWRSIKAERDAGSRLCASVPS